MALLDPGVDLVVEFSRFHGCDDLLDNGGQLPVVFHECAHLILHSRKTIYLDGNGISNATAELDAEADDWASYFLIPLDGLTRFITRFTYEEGEVVEFAAKHGIALGIVVGQLHPISHDAASH
ncbi:MAG: ImmA/IrrE family metallo-endopeptidase [Alphaproteobacteria bacterium]|nr:ImmA/IrrE family metallo-endopeptidase [Alphaproteobacteria bacterium]